MLTVNQITWVVAVGAAIIKVEMRWRSFMNNGAAELLDDGILGHPRQYIQMWNTLGALALMDVHNRDITEWLSETSICAVSEFDWQAQLRYYWADAGASSQTGRPEPTSCRMINAMILYAYEYIGNCGRLVITPLTDRCYRTADGRYSSQLRWSS